MLYLQMLKESALVFPSEETPSDFVLPKRQLRRTLDLHASRAPRNVLHDILPCCHLRVELGEKGETGLSGFFRTRGSVDICAAHRSARCLHDISSSLGRTLQRRCSTLHSHLQPHKLGPLYLSTTVSHPSTSWLVAFSNTCARQSRRTLWLGLIRLYRPRMLTQNAGGSIAIFEP